MLLVIINMREQCLSGARLVSLFPPDGTLERSTDVPDMEEILGLSKDDNDDDDDDDDEEEDNDDDGDDDDQPFASKGRQARPLVPEVAQASLPILIVRL